MKWKKTCSTKIEKSIRNLSASNLTSLVESEMCLSFIIRSMTIIFAFFFLLVGGELQTAAAAASTQTHHKERHTILFFHIRRSQLKSYQIQKREWKKVVNNTARAHIRCAARYRVHRPSTAFFYGFWHMRRDDNEMRGWSRKIINRHIPSQHLSLFFRVAREVYDYNCSSVAFIFINKLNSSFSLRKHEKSFANKHFYVGFIPPRFLRRK